MSQPLPPSLPALKARAAVVGFRTALEEAAETIDALADAYGRLRDKKIAMHPVSMLIGFLLGIAVCAFKGCTTTIDAHSKVEGWPSLTVYEHYVPHHVMRDRCVKYTAFGSYPEACAEIRLSENRCDIFYSADFPPSQAVIDHERLHCAGFDHVGDNSLRDALNKWRSNGLPR